MPLPVRATAGTALASLARTADATKILYPAGHRGVRVFIHVSAVADTPSVVPSIQVQHPLTEPWGGALLTGAALTATNADPGVILTVHPDATAAANTVANSTIGSAIRIFMDHADTDSIPYSVGY